FFHTHPLTTSIYTLSLHDALPISASVTEVSRDCNLARGPMGQGKGGASAASNGKIRLSPHQEVFVSDLYTFPPPPSSDAIEWPGDRKSTRLNSSHVAISYAVFCLK